MTTISVSDFRNRVSGMLSMVEEGEELILLRHGKPIARILPVENEVDHIPNWKLPSLRLSVKGTNLSRAIIEERRDEDLF